MLARVEPKLQGGVLTGFGVRCAVFNISNAIGDLVANKAGDGEAKWLLKEGCALMA